MNPNHNQAFNLGYGSKHYAETFAEVGQPLFLQHSASWLIKRPIAGTSSYDAMGVYPLCLCPDWPGLGRDLAMLDEDILAVSLVTDPFGDFKIDDLKELFPDVCSPFKNHYVTDLSASPEKFVSSHHRYYARKSIRENDFGLCSDPGRRLELNEKPGYQYYYKIS